MSLVSQLLAQRVFQDVRCSELSPALRGTKGLSHGCLVSGGGDAGPGVSPLVRGVDYTVLAHGFKQAGIWGGARVSRAGCDSRSMSLACFLWLLHDFVPLQQADGAPSSSPTVLTRALGGTAATHHENRDEGSWCYGEPPALRVYLVRLDPPAVQIT